MSTLASDRAFVGKVRFSSDSRTPEVAGSVSIRLAAFVKEDLIPSLEGIVGGRSFSGTITLFEARPDATTEAWLINRVSELRGTEGPGLRHYASQETSGSNVVLEFSVGIEAVAGERATTENTLRKAIEAWDLGDHEISRTTLLGIERIADEAARSPASQSKDEEVRAFLAQYNFPEGRIDRVEEQLTKEVLKKPENYSEAFAALRLARRALGSDAMKRVLQQYLDHLRATLLEHEGGSKGNFGTFELNDGFAVGLNRLLDELSLRLETPYGPAKLAANRPSSSHVRGRFQFVVTGGAKGSSTSLPTLSLMGQPDQARRRPQQSRGDVGQG